MSAVLVSHENMSSSELRQDIQGLRGLAVMLVVVFHSGFALPGGFIGVDVFFVLSGFLIIGLLDREAERTGRIDLAAFFARRARRLLPALSIMTTITVLVSIAAVELGAPLRAVARTAMGASVFSANLVLYREADDYFAADAELNPLLHTWSLSVEEQFYFFVPVGLALALALSGRRRSSVSRRRVWALLLSAGAFASFALNVFLVDLGGRVLGIEEAVPFAFYAPVTRAWQFALGGALALLVASGRLPSRATGPGLLSFGLILIAGSALLLGNADGFPGARSAIPTVATLIALAPGSLGVVRRQNPVMSALSSRPLVIVGNLSYSWYLWHWPAIVLARSAFGSNAFVTLAAILFSFLAAIASKQFIEDSFRFNQRLVGVRALALAIICVIVPLASAILLDNANARASDRFGIGPSDSSWSRACLVTRDRPAEWLPNLCTRGREAVDSPAVDVLLLGDSHADALSDGVLAAAESLGLSVGVRTVSGQPPLGRTGWVPRHAELIELTRPSVVVLAARSTGYVKSRDGWERWLGEAELDTASLTSIGDLWVEELVSAVQTFSAIGPRVIWVQNVPEFDEARSGPLGGTLLFPYRYRSISLEQLAEQRGALLALEHQALSDTDSAFVIDPAEAFCVRECRNGDGRQFFYSDSNHLSPSGSRRLAVLIREVLLEAVGE